MPAPETSASRPPVTAAPAGSGPLPRSAPSRQQVDAGRVVAFLDAVEASGLDLHSLIILRHGTVVAEGWWAPYQCDDIQLLYSLSKTFLAMAIGIAIGEGRLAVDDLVADLLPGLVPDPLPAHLRDLRVRHLLSMASGHSDETLGRLIAMGPDLVRSFLSLKPEQAPGSIFTYNQGNSLTLSQLISTLTGECAADYLRSRLFDPMGIERAEWLSTPTGISQGFSGLHVTTESIAKLGQLLLQGGRWGDAQLVPADFVADCRRAQISNAGRSASPDWQQGYGYHMWMSRHRSQRADGAFGQFALVLPEADAVVACTAQVMEMQTQLDLIWEHLLPAFGSADSDPSRDRELASRLARLSTATIQPSGYHRPDPVELPLTSATGPYADRVERIRIEPLRGGSRLVITVSGITHAFDVPDGQWADGSLPGLHTPYPEVCVSAGWVTEQDYHADIVSRRTPHRLQLRARTAPATSLSAGWLAAPLALADL